MKKKLSIVYDITKRCPWNCAICCMGASSDKAVCGDEPLLSEKLQMIDNIAQVRCMRDVRIDFSGGEIFTNMDHVQVIEHAASLLGRENIGISTSGYRVDDTLAKQLSACVSECEMTMDTVPDCEYPLRPKGYASAAAKALPYLKKYGITTGIQTVLARSNCNEKMLRDMYGWICSHEVDNWSLLKFYPSGRGAAYQEEKLTKEEELWAVRYITEMNDENLSVHKPQIDFHYTMEGHKKYTAECRCVKKSIGILPNGDVTACFWAVDACTGIIDTKFRLGNLREQQLTDIISGKEALYWLKCSHHCELGAA